MKVIALSSTYPAAGLSQADIVIPKLDRIQVARDGARMLKVTVG
jgi:hypothetical protein